MGIALSQRSVQWFRLLCIAALLGGAELGRWLLAPAAAVISVRRRYQDDSLVLESEFRTRRGRVRIIDFMPISNQRWDVVRIVEGLSGGVRMHIERAAHT